VLVAVPAGAVTLILPVVAPAGTVAVILIVVSTLKSAVVPLNLIEVVPVKLAPLIVTLEPITPEVGLKLEILGATTKSVGLVAVPPGVVTVIFPVVALAGTVVEIWIAELTVNEAAVPLNLTEVAPVKFVPLIVTGTPTAPLGGEKVEIAGMMFTVKLVALTAVPAAVVTLIGPVVAKEGTVALI